MGNGIDTNSLGFSETMNPGFVSRTMKLLNKTHLHQDFDW